MRTSFIFVAFATGCASRPAPSSLGASSASTSAVALPSAPMQGPATTSQQTPPPESAHAPAAVRSAVPDASSDVPLAAPSTPQPPRRVKVTNIGMHIGGHGDINKDENKTPIRDSVAPHFPEFEACWTRIGDHGAKGDVGVDLLIPREGGRPKKVDNVRSTIKHDGFRECVVSTFAAIEFKKPKTGLTKVSYSLRFIPEPAGR